jgi:hypothetical protein
MDRRDLERFVLGERRENGRQPPSEHRLPRTRRADEKTRMSAGRRDLQRALGARLPRDVREIHVLVARHALHRSLGAGQRSGPQ